MWVCSCGKGLAAYRTENMVESSITPGVWLVTPFTASTSVTEQSSWQGHAMRTSMYYRLHCLHPCRTTRRHLHTDPSISTFPTPTLTTSFDDALSSKPMEVARSQKRLIGKKSMGEQGDSALGESPKVITHGRENLTNSCLDSLWHLKWLGNFDTGKCIRSQILVR
jgi:hypothetical protein